MRVIREALGIRNSDLAARVGFTRSTLTHIEQGARQVSPATISKIAQALGVPLEAISYPVIVAKKSEAFSATLPKI
ncbi:hypothetical protein GCM10022198_00520 [Klugiella xanthotipulae]